MGRSVGKKNSHEIFASETADRSAEVALRSNTLIEQSASHSKEIVIFFSFIKLSWHETIAIVMKCIVAANLSPINSCRGAIQLLAPH